ncbi:MAG TPA: hypothetical protein DCR04_10075 [Flavobacteriales bacterium]|nr:hypothetical protein [Flavobacteriales bacterium]
MAGTLPITHCFSAEQWMQSIFIARKRTFFLHGSFTSCYSVSYFLGLGKETSRYCMIGGRDYWLNFTRAEKQYRLE